MVKIISMPLGAYETNCYLVWEEQSSSCVVIDPGYEASVIRAEMEKQGKTLAGILLTHGHFDHVGAVRELVMDEDTPCPVYLCADDLAMPPRLTAGPLYYTDTYGEGDTVELAGLTFRVLHTPGHTAGSVCLVTEDVIFSGDTLFRGSCGRTDLCGDSAQMLRSLERLRTLPGNYRVFPGHGPVTTLDEERRYNPYMKGTL